MGRLVQRLRAFLPNFLLHPSEAVPNRAIQAGARVRRIEDDRSGLDCPVGSDGRISPYAPGFAGLGVWHRTGREGGVTIAPSAHVSGYRLRPAMGHPRQHMPHRSGVSEFGDVMIPAPSIIK